MKMDFQYNYEPNCVPLKDRVLRYGGWKVGRSWSSWCQDWKDSFGNSTYGSSFSERFLQIWQKKVSDQDWEQWEDAIGLCSGTITSSDEKDSVVCSLFYGLFSCGAFLLKEGDSSSLVAQVGLAKESVCFALSVVATEAHWLCGTVQVQFCEQWKKKISPLWDRCLAYAANPTVPELSSSFWVSGQCWHRGFVGMVEGQIGKGAMWGKLQLLDQEDEVFSIFSLACKVGGVGMQIGGYLDAHGLGVRGMIGLIPADPE